MCPLIQRFHYEDFLHYLLDEALDTVVFIAMANVSYMLSGY